MILTGILFAVLFLGRGWIRRRPYYATAAGWCVAGLAVPTFFAGLNQHPQYTLFLFLGGIGTILQGTWELIHSMRLRRSRSTSD